MNSARDVMRWRLYAETAFHPWVMSRRIFGGDIVLVKEGDLTQVWQWNPRLAGKEGMVIGGVAMTGGRRDVADQIRVATTGGFEFPVVGGPCYGSLPEVGDFVAPAGPDTVRLSQEAVSIGKVYSVDAKQGTVRFTLHGTERLLVGADAPAE